MARRSISRCGMPAALVLALTTGIVAPSVRAADDAAHAIAQRFADEHARAERRATAEARRNADAAAAERRARDERDMLARAKAEAAERARLDAERLAEDVRQRAIAEDQRRRAEAEAAERARLAAEERKAADEQRRLAEAAEQQRREQEATARIRAESMAAEERRRRAAADAERVQREAEARRQAELEAERLHQAEAQSRARAAEAERTAELERIGAQLRRIAKEAEARDIAKRSASERTAGQSPSAPASRSVAGEPAGRTPDDDGQARNSVLSSARRAAVNGDTHDGRVTVLMVMEPGSRGIRRFEKTADPLICFERHCFVSNGAGQPARALTRFQAFGTFNTLGGRAGACRNSLACAYPGIDLDTEGHHVQPVDLRIMRHDRREVRELKADPTCGVVRGTLVCGKAVQAETWRIWVVPQAVADAAGPELIEAALSGGLGRDQLALR